MSENTFITANGAQSKYLFNGQAPCLFIKGCTASSVVEWMAAHCFFMAKNDKHPRRKFRQPNVPSNEKR